MRHPQDSRLGRKEPRDERQKTGFFLGPTGTVDRSAQPNHPRQGQAPRRGEPGNCRLHRGGGCQQAGTDPHVQRRSEDRRGRRTGLGRRVRGPRRYGERRFRGPEAAEPEFFDQLVLQTYNGYYTNPEVFELIGYTIPKPAPPGSRPELLDVSLLDQQRKREPFWKKT